MNDLISRQDAIDTLWEIRREEIIDGRRFENHCSLSTAVDVIRDLPSAQQEIVRCRDCKHFEYDHPYIIQGVPVLGHEVCNAWGDGCRTDENGYCFLAERKEGGADEGD